MINLRKLIEETTTLSGGADPVRDQARTNASWHAIDLEAAMTQIAEAEGRDQAWVLNQLSATTLASTMDLMTKPHVSEVTRKGLLDHLINIPGFDPKKEASEQHDEVRRYYAYQIAFFIWAIRKKADQGALS